MNSRCEPSASMVQPFGTNLNSLPNDVANETCDTELLCYSQHRQ